MDWSPVITKAGIIQRPQNTAGIFRKQKILSASIILEVCSNTIGTENSKEKRLLSLFNPTRLFEVARAFAPTSVIVLPERFNDCKRLSLFEWAKATTELSVIIFSLKSSSTISTTYLDSNKT